MISLVVIYSSLVALRIAAADSIDSLEELRLDDNGHLFDHHLLFTEGCKEFDDIFLESEGSRVHTAMTDDLAVSLYGHSADCIAAVLHRGTPQKLLQYIFEEDMISSNVVHGEPSISQWLRQKESLELGWISYHERDCYVYWVSGDETLTPISILKPGEKHTFWTSSYFNHEFVVKDAETDEVLGEYRAEYDAFYVIGVNPLDSNLNPEDDKADEIKEELQSVYFETTAVKRTFSEIGFKKGKLPLDVFASISAYYYNNINHFTNEEQVSRSVFVNYWQAPCYFLGMPWGLKKLWQKKLLKLVQAWVGDQTPLETSDIYGIRAYSEGARLLSHVDRITTHAVSLIINVAQVNVLEPWFVEIYDFAGRLHEIEMQPGEVVYYEVMIISSILVF